MSKQLRLLLLLVATAGAWRVQVGSRRNRDLKHERLAPLIPYSPPTS
jgi:hypothetical protein